MLVNETIARFDEYLQSRGLAFEGIVVGGAALSLLGVVSRETHDCDVLHPSIPQEIRDAADAFGKAETGAGRPMSKNWFNNGPASLTKDLPTGWENRLLAAYIGKALRLRALGRMDLLRAKLYAYCDREYDLEDCIALQPTSDELEVIGPWLAQKDANPGWPEYVKEKLDRLTSELDKEDFGSQGEIVARYAKLKVIAKQSPLDLTADEIQRRTRAIKEMERLEPLYVEAKAKLTHLKSGTSVGR